MDQPVQKEFRPLAVNFAAAKICQISFVQKFFTKNFLLLGKNPLNHCFSIFNKDLYKDSSESMLKASFKHSSFLKADCI